MPVIPGRLERMSAAGISIERVKAFLEAYASAFQRLDKDAVADRYAYPAHVVTYNGGVRLLAVPTREARRAGCTRVMRGCKTAASTPAPRGPRGLAWWGCGAEKKKSRYMSSRRRTP